MLKLVARFRIASAFGRRCIPAGGVAPSSHMGQYARASRLANRVHRRPRCTSQFGIGPLTTGLLVFALAAGIADAQGVRERMRPGARGTKVSSSQAIDLTLTVGEVSVRPVQTYLRAAGTADKAAKVVSAYLYPPAAGLVKVGQRARTFPVESRSSMFQAHVTKVIPEANRVRVELTLSANGRTNVRDYLLEILADRGEFLSVPNEAIIEEGETHVVYVQRQGQYEPQPIEVGVQGELYTQVMSGLSAGDHVVTFGSFFIDSEYKLKGTAETERP